MKFKDISSECIRRGNLGGCMSQRDGVEFLKRFLELLREEILGAGNARLFGLGYFKVVRLKPTTRVKLGGGEIIHVPARDVVRFKMGVELEEALAEKNEGGNRQEV